MVLKIFNKKNINNEFSLDMFFVKNPNLRPYVISSTLINKNIYVHNGKNLTLVSITSKMIGHKMGEFVITKTLGREFQRASEKKRNKKKRRK